MLPVSSYFCLYKFCVYGGLQLGSSLSFHGSMLKPLHTCLLTLSIIVSHSLLFSVCIHIFLGKLASMAKLEVVSEPFLPRLKSLWRSSIQKVVAKVQVSEDDDTAVQEHLS